jgi:hypothetical protein
MIVLSLNRTVMEEVDGVLVTKEPGMDNDLLGSTF